MSFARTADITSAALAPAVNAGNAASPRPADASDSAFPDRPRDVMPCGTSCNRNAAATTHLARRTRRNNPDAYTAGPKNSRELALGADPRALQLAVAQAARAADRELARGVVPGSVPGSAAVRGLGPPGPGSAPRSAAAAQSSAGNDGSAPGGIPCLVPWPAKAPRPAISATSAPPAGRRRCRNDIGDGWAGTDVHISGADNAAAENGTLTPPPLVQHRRQWNTEVGPRELSLPEGQVSEASCRSLRDAFIHLVGKAIVDNL